MANKTQEYRVTWEVDIVASCPREAAEMACAMQHDVESESVFFDVKDPAGRITQVDLLEPDPLLESFLDGYLACALWTLTDDNGEPCDHMDRDDIDPNTLATLLADATDFYKANRAAIGDRAEQAGHDFWLTRNGHGAGFWDGDWPEHGDELTEASDVYGGHDLTLSEDGLTVY